MKSNQCVQNVELNGPIIFLILNDIDQLCSVKRLTCNKQANQNAVHTSRDLCQQALCQTHTGLLYEQGVVGHRMLHL